MPGSATGGRPRRPAPPCARKGYGLRLVVDLGTGVLAGTPFGPNVVDLFSPGGRSETGHLVAAIDIEAVADRADFENRLETYIDQLAATPTAQGAAGPVVFPAQPEAERTARSRREGIVVDRAHFDSLARLAAQLDLPEPPATPHRGGA